MGMNLGLFRQTLLLMHERRPPILSLSGPGLGKTAVHQQVAATLKELTQRPWGYCQLVMTNHDPVEIGGYLVPSRRSDGVLVSEFTLPFFWSIIGQWDGVNQFGILHFDEITDADYAGQKIAARAVHDRMVGSHKLPAGCWILLSGNRRKDKSGVQRMATMFQNRVRTIDLDYDTDLHIQYSLEVGLNPLAIAFIKSHAGLIYNDTVPNEPGPFCSPRSFEEGVRDVMELARLYKYPHPSLPGLDLTKEEGKIAQGLLIGAVGAGLTAEFYTYMKYADQLPTMEQIAVAPDKAKVPDSMGGQFMTAFMVAQSAKDAILAAVVRYIWRLRTEMQIICVKNLFERHQRRNELPTLATTPGVAAFCAKHQDVLILSAKV